MQLSYEFRVRNISGRILNRNGDDEYKLEYISFTLFFLTHILFLFV